MSFSSDSPDAKKPCKGILKSSSSFDKHSSAATSAHRKSAKFDELNVLQTYHPPDKDYGHMKVDEPKTPYNYAEEADVDELDAELLVERLRVAANSRTESVSEEESEEEEEELNEEQKKRKVEFERRRKLHYNEFEAVKMARKLIEEEDDDEDDAGPRESPNRLASAAIAGSSASTAAAATVSPTSAPHDEVTRMEVEEPDGEVDHNGATLASKFVGTSDSLAPRLKPVPSVAIIEEGSELQAPRSSVIALIMLVSVGLMIFFIVCFTFLFYWFKQSRT
ncbi:protein phosphatase inhibitor 2 [Anopheles bellator]|uniref:protein phosphatase inhibitor 2 n=1 Tax=Anopheles bellator TaxID=139047 RepID=UPI002649A52A|nr:protein phosphatase inhibitor 2 [Anopheles bellator]